MGTPVTLAEVVSLLRLMVMAMVVAGCSGGGCPSCAGTLYKPNISVELGRSFLFVECPCCDPVAFRKRVERLKDKLPKGSGPVQTPLSELQDREDFEKRRAEANLRKQERLKRLK